MSNKDLLSELLKEASFIQQHLERLQQKPDEVSGLDIDMLADKLKDLYAKILELETESAIQEIKEPPLVTAAEKPPLVEVKPEPEIPAPKPPEMKHEPVDSTQYAEGSKEDEESATSDQQPATSNQPPAISDQQSASSHQRPAISDQQPAISDQQQEASNPEPEIKTTADLFSGPTTIAEQFETREDKSIAARVAPQAIENLKMAIGINDKFLFINELFKGNPSEYNEAIEKLNDAGSMPTAETTIQEYSVRYEWSDQSEAFARLKKIVTAKFNES